MKRNKKTCDKCSHDYSLSCFDRHYKRCDGNITYWKKRASGELTVDNETICKFCQKQCKNANSQRNHSRLCKSNPNRHQTFIETNKDDPRIKNKKYSNQYVRAKELGLPIPQMSEENKRKLREASKNKTPEQRKAQALKSSQTIKNKVAKGEWHTSLAKRMHYDYKGIDLHGKWELKYATWLDSQNIKWIRCKESFEYNFENKVRHYTPDFYLTDSDTYIEIKGFKTEKDDAKWKQFSKKLIVLTKAELKELGII
jgi:hypothetical protein